MAYAIDAYALHCAEREDDPSCGDVMGESPYATPMKMFRAHSNARNVDQIAEEPVRVPALLIVCTLTHTHTPIDHVYHTRLSP